MLELSPLQFKNQTTPSNPASGILSLYAKNNKIFQLDSTGAETDLTLFGNTKITTNPNNKNKLKIGTWSGDAGGALTNTSAKETAIGYKGNFHIMYRSIAGTTYDTTINSTNTWNIDSKPLLDAGYDLLYVLEFFPASGSVDNLVAINTDLAARSGYYYTRYINFLTAAKADGRFIWIAPLHEFNGNNGTYPWQIYNTGNLLGGVPNTAVLLNIFDLLGIILTEQNMRSQVGIVQTFDSNNNGSNESQISQWASPKVDSYGVDVYNRNGTDPFWNVWKPFSVIFEQIYSELSPFGKPIMIQESGSIPEGGVWTQLGNPTCVVITNGGTASAVNDIITVSSTFPGSIPATLKVTSVTAGAITGLITVNPGAFLNQGTLSFLSSGASNGYILTVTPLDDNGSRSNWINEAIQSLLARYTQVTHINFFLETKVENGFTLNWNFQSQEFTTIRESFSSALQTNLAFARNWYSQAFDGFTADQVQWNKTSNWTTDSTTLSLVNYKHPLAKTGKALKITQTGVAGAAGSKNTWLNSNKNSYIEGQKAWIKLILASSLDNIPVDVTIQEQTGDFDKLNTQSRIVNKQPREYWFPIVYRSADTTPFTGWRLPILRTGHAPACDIYILDLKIFYTETIPNRELLLTDSDSYTIGFNGADYDIKNPDNAGAEISAYILNLALKNPNGANIFYLPGVIFADQIIVPTTGGVISFYGGGEGRTILRQTAGSNKDFIISENFYTHHDTNYNDYTGVKRLHLQGMTVDGNSGGQTSNVTFYTALASFPVTGVANIIYVDEGTDTGYTWSGSAYVTTAIKSNGKTWRYYLNTSVKLYGYFFNLRDLEIVGSKNVALCTEYSNSQGNTMNDYEPFESVRQNIHIKGCGTFGDINAGSHDSMIVREIISASRYDTEIRAGYFAENNGNSGSQGQYVFGLHVWMPSSPNGYGAHFRNSSHIGDIYVEGSPNEAVRIEGGSSQLRIQTGFVNSANTNTNRTAVRVIANGTGVKANNNQIDVQGFYGPINGDLLTVEVKNGGQVSYGDFKVSIHDGCTITGAMVREIVDNNAATNYSNNNFTQVSGQANVIVNNTDKQKGGNNKYTITQTYNTILFSTYANLAATDTVDAVSHNNPDTNRISIWRKPMGDTRLEAYYNGATKYFSFGGLNVKDVAPGVLGTDGINKNQLDIAVPSQTGNAGKYLTTNGTITNWATVAGGTTPLTTKGDLYTYDTAGNRLPVGTNGQVLSVDSTTATGLKWVAPSGGGSTTDASLLTSGTLADARLSANVQLKAEKGVANGYVGYDSNKDIILGYGQLVRSSATAGTPYIGFNGARSIINGGAQPIEIQNFVELFLPYNAVNPDPKWQLFYSGNRTINIANDGGGQANFSVQNTVDAQNVRVRSINIAGYTKNDATGILSTSTTIPQADVTGLVTALSTTGYKHYTVVGATGSNYTTLQSALDALTTAGTIFIKDGTYVTPAGGYKWKYSGVTIINESTKVIHQFDSAVASTFLSSNVHDAITINNNLVNCYWTGQCTINQTGTAVTGTVFDFSDMVLSGVKDYPLVTNALSCLTLNDTTLWTFYNTFELQQYGCKYTVFTPDTATKYSNHNRFRFTRGAVANVAGACGLYLNWMAGNTFETVNSEPISIINSTGIKFNTNVFSNTFKDVWIEGNAKGIDTTGAVGCFGNTFIGGTITANTVDITDTLKICSFINTQIGSQSGLKFNTGAGQQGNSIEVALNTPNPVNAINITNGTTYAHNTDLVTAKLQNGTDAASIYVADTNGTGKNFVGKNNGVTTFSVDKTGQITSPTIDQLYMNQLLYS
jgi:hypothetical protein